MRALTIERVETLLSEAISDDNRGEIDRWSQRLDELDEADRARRDSLSLLGAALWYAKQGLHVFPLMSLSKRPWPRSHGCHDATTDVEQIKSWWAAAPTSNVGIATGHVVDVIDVDGLAANVELLRRFESEALWARVMSGVIGSVTTPRAGGRHLYVPTMERGNRARMGKRNGLDYRGLGGYVVAPPSKTDARDNQVSGVYRWTRALSL